MKFEFRLCDPRISADSKYADSFVPWNSRTEDNTTLVYLTREEAFGLAISLLEAYKVWWEK
jgi:hypothetical protein